MPQMYPMNWIMMFITFILIFIVSMNKIFYSPFINSSINDLKSFNNYSNIWKW